MAWRLDMKSIHVPIHPLEASALRAAYMATTSAYVMVVISSVPLASMKMVVRMGI
jgi:hypothetical protein